ncbi:hypothetical protein KSP40_PGU011962 [Platanthera guangdongensis]|uniref:Uncharacterized protein n=1 Tax=Platanthera guangdongensis TaxID=2320717 RepID=A0ABR2MTN5_9ASPA
MKSPLDPGEEDGETGVVEMAGNPDSLSDDILEVSEMAGNRAIRSGIPPWMMNSRSLNRKFRGKKTKK